MPVSLDSPITQLPGVGEARSKKLEKLGLRRCGDLLTYYPRDYEDRRQMYSIQDAPLDIQVCIQATVADYPRRAFIRKGLELVHLEVWDHTGLLYLTFFNQGFVERALQKGREYIFFGTVKEQGYRRSMTNPIFEEAGKQHVTGRIMPIYPLTAGISNQFLFSLIRLCLPCAAEAPDFLPLPIRQRWNLSPLEFSLRAIHSPPDEESLALARRRLTFEELFYLSVGLTFLKKRRAFLGKSCTVSPSPWAEFASLLPFQPTDAQRRVMEEVAADLTSGRPMNRLVQGDVGSGKTAVAAYAAFLVGKGGYQVALMAPTEILATQHYRSLSALLSPAGIRVGLLTGALSPSERAEQHRALAEGEIDVAVGTQALLSPGVTFRRLALIIADEQHRFGVAQRAALSGKSETGGMPPPHVLVMSATPIPRTLALIIYGDLDISVIDQLPPGRTPVETYVVREDKRERMYNFVRRQVAEGRQVYIVCPAVEEDPNTALLGEASPSPDRKAVKTYAAHLQKEVFPNLRVEILHGKLPPRSKAEVMAAFVRGEIQVLVSTTVIEVGVDVPNASLMIVENADRFGLSQLHQLRGRVGRGKHHSYCVLITSTRSTQAIQRLRTLASTSDGFRIAEEDLKLRGPGDFFGSRQHGLPQLKLADLSGDMRLFQQAQQAAQALLEEDPPLSLPENAPVRSRVQQLFSDTPDIFN